MSLILRQAAEPPMSTTPRRVKPPPTTAMPVAGGNFASLNTAVGILLSLPVKVALQNVNLIPMANQTTETETLMRSMIGACV